ALLALSGSAPGSVRRTRGLRGAGRSPAGRARTRRQCALTRPWPAPVRRHRARASSRSSARSRRSEHPERPRRAARAIARGGARMSAVNREHAGTAVLVVQHLYAGPLSNFGLALGPGLHVLLG